MTAILIEHSQFLDSSGAPISGGKQYFGTAGADPVATAGVTSIFSNRALTSAISNPQTLDSNGRTASKVWIAGKYSTQVNSVVGVVETQEFQDLDAGTASSALASLFVGSIVGGDTITGSTDSSLSTYTANQQFVFETVSANTGPVTLNVDGVGAKAIVKNNDQPLVDGDFAANQVCIGAYNSTNDNFEWLNKNDKVVQFSEGSPVVAAATTDIWATDGNTIHITGTTGITSFGTAPNVGARRRLIVDGIVVFTNSANLALPGGVNYTTAAGDILDVYADTVTQFDIIIHSKSALPALDGSLLTGIQSLQSIQTFDTSLTWTRPAGITRVLVYVTGGGQGGDSCVNGSPASVPSGQAGGTAIKFLDVSAIATADITIGAAGATNLGTGGDSDWDDGTNIIVGEGGGTGTGNSGEDISLDARGNGANSQSVGRVPGPGSFWGRQYGAGGFAEFTASGTKNGDVGRVGFVVVMEY